MSVNIVGQQWAEKVDHLDVWGLLLAFLNHNVRAESAKKFQSSEYLACWFLGHLDYIIVVGPY